MIDWGLKYGRSDGEGVARDSLEKNWVGEGGGGSCVTHELASILISSRTRAHRRTTVPIGRVKTSSELMARPAIEASAYYLAAEIRALPSSTPTLSPIRQPAGTREIQTYQMHTASENQQREATTTTQASTTSFRKTRNCTAPRLGNNQAIKAVMMLQRTSPKGYRVHCILTRGSSFRPSSPSSSFCSCSSSAFRRFSSSCRHVFHVTASLCIRIERERYYRAGGDKNAAE